MDLIRTNFFFEFAKANALSLHGFSEALSIGSFTQDTRKLAKGDVYVALRGENFDGHSFGKTAAAKGASLLILEEKLELECPYILVKDSLKFLQEFARAYRIEIDVKIIGLTGTNGKTTCKEMIDAALAPEFKTSKTVGNYNNHIGVPLTLGNIPSDTDIAIVEMGTNHKGEIAFLAEMVRPNISFVSCVGYGHMAFFESLEAVAIEKTSIFTFTKDLAILNQTDPHLKDAPLSIPRKTIGYEESNDFCLKIMGLNKSGGAIGQLNDIHFSLQIAGKHHALNAAFAIACAGILGVSGKNIEKRMNGFVAVSGRMETVKLGHYTFINDAYNANPNSMKAACEFFEELETDLPKIFVLGDMLELGESASSQHQAIVNRLMKDANVFLFGKHFAMLETGFQKFESQQDIAAAIKDNFTEAYILLKGSRGMQLEKVMDGFKQSEASNVK